MLVVRGIIGAIILFLGRELNFIFAAGMATLISFRLTPLLPSAWPSWADTAFIVGMAVLAAVLVLIEERAGYFISGFLAGGYVLTEYYAPGVLAVPILPFFVGGVLGSLILGIFTEWALIVVSSVIGAIYLTGMFLLSDTARILLTAGLVIIGALVQVLIMRAQKQ
ncbi:MAG TPA: hypothetical protein VMJ90_04410 [Anaerolineales bacterium]|nr:hypothetical protein [Anaerolineales bacterium]